MKACSVYLALALLLALLSTAGERHRRSNRDQIISIRPIAFHSGDSRVRTVGALEFLGAWELTSNHERFGGFSGLAILPGDRLLALSDAAEIAVFAKPAPRRSVRQMTAAIAPLPWKGKQEPTYKDRDAESLAYDAQTGRFWVGYEQRHAIRRFSLGMAREDGIARPAQMRGWPSNGGAESLARLNDGRLLVLAESDESRVGGYSALLFPADPVNPLTALPLAFSYLPPDGFKPTDAVQLPDGKLLILHRSLSLPSGFGAALTIADPARITPGRPWSGKLIAKWGAPLLIDNMEGLAIEQSGGKTIIWIISDNNFTLLQRTLLMKFALPATFGTSPDTEKGRAARARPGFHALP